MTEKEFNQLLSSYLDGDLSESQLLAFKDAIEETPIYRHQFQKEVRLHTLLNEVTAEQKEEKKLQRLPKKKKIPKKKPQWSPILLAATIMLAGFMVFLIFFLTQNRKIEIGECSFIGDNGILLVLRDQKEQMLRENDKIYKGDKILNPTKSSSMISLNDGSILSILQNAELGLWEQDDVQISLHEGEVLLEITKRAPDAGPFIVSTNQTKVTVVGTIFSVKIEEESTRVDVFEGKVNVQRIEDQQSIDLNENHFMHSDTLEERPFEDIEPEESNPPSKMITILPSDDIYLENNKIHNNALLKVEGKRRKIYLRFEIEGVGNIDKAILELKQDTDPGGGTMRFFEGSHANWSEKKVQKKDLPKHGSEFSKYRGAVHPNQTLSIDCSKLIQKDGIYTVIITLDQGEAKDIWFSSKDGNTAPKLILTPTKK